MSENENTKILELVDILAQIAGGGFTEDFNEWRKSLMLDPSIKKVNSSINSATISEPENFNDLIVEWFKSKTR